MEATPDPDEFIKAQLLQVERRSFAVRILFYAIGYVSLTLWLNSIRATAAHWFVWTLIIIQFLFYFAIFVSSYRRSVVCGLNKPLAFGLFLALTFLGRVNNWEQVIIPAVVVIMFAVSAVNKKVSARVQLIVPTDNVPK
jgi:hypothetical protein